MILLVICQKSGIGWMAILLLILMQRMFISPEAALGLEARYGNLLMINLRNMLKNGSH